MTESAQGAKTNLSGEAAEEGVPEVAEREGEVLVEEVPEELAHAQVRPAPVHEQQPLEEAELRNREVARQHGLQAFLPADADADVGG